MLNNLNYRHWSCDKSTNFFAKPFHSVKTGVWCAMLLHGKNNYIVLSSENWPAKSELDITKERHITQRTLLRTRIRVLPWDHLHCHLPRLLDLNVWIFICGERRKRQQKNIFNNLFVNPFSPTNSSILRFV